MASDKMCFAQFPFELFQRFANQTALTILKVNKGIIVVCFQENDVINIHNSHCIGNGNNNALMEHMAGI